MTTDWATGGSKNVEVMDDLDYAVKTGEYSRKISRYETQLKAWSDNIAKGYAFILQHYPEELQAELKNQEARAAIDDTRSIVRQLVLIKIAVQQVRQKRLIMATVEADFNLYLYTQGSVTVDEYYKVFTSRVDTINANGGNAGLYPSVFKKYFQPLKDKVVEETGKDLAGLTMAELKTIETEATLGAKDAAQGEYFTCMFLMLSDDERYGPLKTQLDSNFLMGKQEYPSDVLAAKRLMTDFFPATDAVKHKRQESGPSDVAFVETGGSGPPHATTVESGTKRGT